MYVGMEMWPLLMKQCEWIQPFILAMNQIEFIRILSAENNHHHNQLLCKSTETISLSLLAYSINRIPSSPTIISHFDYASDSVPAELSVGNPCISLPFQILTLGVSTLCEHLLRREELWLHSKLRGRTASLFGGRAVHHPRSGCDLVLIRERNDVVRVVTDSTQTWTWTFPKRNERRLLCTVICWKQWERLSMYALNCILSG